jgi:hypothetical protein
VVVESDLEMRALLDSAGQTVLPQQGEGVFDKERKGHGILPSGVIQNQGAPQGAFVQLRVILGRSRPRRPRPLLSPLDDPGDLFQKDFLVLLRVMSHAQAVMSIFGYQVESLLQFTCIGLSCCDRLKGFELAFHHCRRAGWDSHLGLRRFSRLRLAGRLAAAIGLIKAVGDVSNLLTSFEFTTDIRNCVGRNADHFGDLPVRLLRHYPQQIASKFALTFARKVPPVNIRG